jgi:putative DNA primase/helicase
MPADLHATALALHQAGICVIPAATDGTKAPWPDGPTWTRYKTTRPDTQDLTRWFGNGHRPGLGVIGGAVSGGLVCLDIEGRAVREGVWQAVMELADTCGLGDTLRTVMRGYFEQTASGGLHILFRTTGTIGNLKLARRPAHDDELANSPGERIKVLIETKAEGGFCILAPSGGTVHPNGQPWLLLAGGPTTITTIPREAADSILGLCRLVDALDPPAPPSAFTNPSRDTDDGGLAPGADYEQRTDWADILTPAGWAQVAARGQIRYWRRPGKNLGISASTGYGTGDWLYVWTTSTEFDSERTYTKFGAYTVLHHGGDHTTAARALKAAGYGQPAPRKERDPTTGEITIIAEPEAHRGQLRMAERLARRHAKLLRHAHDLGWYTWDNLRWAPDRDGAAMRAAVDVVKAAITDLDTLTGQDRDQLYSDIRRAETSAGLAGILTIAATLRPLATQPNQLDANPHLFNTLAGTLDLHTGQTRPADPADLLTKVAGAGLDPTITGTVFERFLTGVLPDPDIAEFVQRLFGYAMLGRATEHVLPIFTGTGQNGKSTLLRVVGDAFGDYAISADPEMLVDRGRAGTHPTGVADLLGVRLAVASETDEGRPLADATVKRLTGGDKIRARRMRQDFFEFDPSHTFIMVTNHKPRVAGDDPALWRRIRVVPFDVVVSDPDPQLPEKLSLELSAVLGWAYAGYQGYVSRGLDAPEVVTVRTDDYKNSSDALGRFLDERTIQTGPQGVVKARELYAAWSEWCRDNGENNGSEVVFAESMGRRGHAKTRRNIGQVYIGVMLSSDGEESGDGWK